MNREYRFDRYRNGRKMAEGLVLTHPKTVYDAVAVASRLAEAGDVFVLRDDVARLAEVEGELSASNAQLASALQHHKADIREMGRLLEDERCKVVAVEGERDALREKAELLDWLLKEGFHHADVSIGDDEDRKPIVYFRITFEIPEPKDWPKYDDEEWRDLEVLAALRAAKGGSK